MRFFVQSVRDQYVQTLNAGGVGGVGVGGGGGGRVGGGAGGGGRGWGVVGGGGRGRRRGDTSVFLEAGGGIRDVETSRGLRDVYKRRVIGDRCFLGIMKLPQISYSRI